MDSSVDSSVVDANLIAQLLPVHVTKQNGGQQIKLEKIPAHNIENERRVTALTFAIQDKFPANAIT